MILINMVNIKLATLSFKTTSTTLVGPVYMVSLPISRFFSSSPTILLPQYAYLLLATVLADEFANSSIGTQLHHFARERAMALFTCLKWFVGFCHKKGRPGAS